MTILFIYLFGSRKFLNTLIMLYICYIKKNAPIHLRSNARLGLVVGSCLGSDLIFCHLVKF